jgi:hypothetical protein
MLSVSSPCAAHSAQSDRPHIPVPELIKVDDRSSVTVLLLVTGMVALNTRICEDIYLFN